jgi:hypothetical protein
MKEIVEYNKVLHSHGNRMDIAIQNTKRCTGHSTGQALRLIGVAMARYEVDVQQSFDTWMESTHFARLVKDLIAKLELKFFVIKVSGKAVILTYKPIGRVEVTRQETIYTIIDTEN